jgi:hypothetical protein
MLLQYPTAALAAHFNLWDCLAQILIVNDRDVAELQTPGLVRPQPSIDCEEHIVVKLVLFPFVAFLPRLVRRWIEAS